MGGLCLPMFGATWYVRPDGGTRYSAKMTKGQCDGTADTPARGSKANQHCAFKDVRYLWQDGSYNYGTGTGVPGWGWIGAGGDTYLIRGSLDKKVSYRVGWNNNKSSCESEGCWGVQGDPYGSGAPAPPSGTAAQHTRILGENYASCHAPGAKTQLHGGYGVGSVLNLAGASYVDVACLDITDFSDCVKNAGCNSSPGTLGDYAATGINWSNTSTNDTVTDVHIHGLAAAGMVGPTGNGVVMSYIDVIGNAGAGWNADSGNGATGTGSLLVQHFNISWNGCSEEYPIVDALPYGNCNDDNDGGYGDGFGTATVQSKPGWAAVFDQGVVSYNTQDGLDALHLTGAGSSMTVTHVLAYGNMGQQLKVGGTSGIMRDNVIFTNCNAMRAAIPGTPKGYNSRLSDFCRASDAGVKLTVNDGSTAVFENNILYSASSTALEVDVDAACTTSCLIQQKNNIFIGFMNNKADGYPSGGTGEYSNPIYVDSGALAAYRNPRSSFDHNITFHHKGNWPCPNKGLNETNGSCGDPHLGDETWPVYGFDKVAMPAGGTAGMASVADPATDDTGSGHTQSVSVLAGEVIGGTVLAGGIYTGYRLVKNSRGD